jgi:hypothetical protein
MKLNDIKFETIYGLGYTFAKWDKQSLTPQSLWVFGVTTDGKYTAVNSYDDDYMNIKLMDNLSELNSLMSWFTTKGWDILTLEEAVKATKRYVNHPLSTIIWMYEPTPAPVKEVVTMSHPNQSRLYRIFWHAKEGYSYGSTGPKYKIDSCDVASRIYKRINEGWSVDFDARDTCIA